VGTHIRVTPHYHPRMGPSGFPGIAYEGESGPPHGDGVTRGNSPERRRVIPGAPLCNVLCKDGNRKGTKVRLDPRTLTA
jgi:hypothetical protein